MTQLTAFADDNLHLAKVTISLFDNVKNPVGKGENAGYQEFLLFPQCFPKPSSQLRIVKRRDCLVKSFTYTTKSLVSMTLRKRNKSFKNNERKEQNAGTSIFFFFPQCYLPILKQIYIMVCKCFDFG